MNEPSRWLNSFEKTKVDTVPWKPGTAVASTFAGHHFHLQRLETNKTKKQSTSIPISSKHIRITWRKKMVSYQGKPKTASDLWYRSKQTWKVKYGSGWSHSELHELCLTLRWKMARRPYRQASKVFFKHFSLEDLEAPIASITTSERIEVQAARFSQTKHWVLLRQRYSKLRNQTCNKKIIIIPPCIRLETEEGRCTELRKFNNSSSLLAVSACFPLRTWQYWCNTQTEVFPFPKMMNCCPECANLPFSLWTFPLRTMSYSWSRTHKAREHLTSCLLTWNRNNLVLSS